MDDFCKKDIMNSDSLWNQYKPSHLLGEETTNYLLTIIIVLIVLITVAVLMGYVSYTYAYGSAVASSS